MDTNLQHSANGNSVAADSAALVGRILLALIFIISGYGKIGGYAGTAGYMASKGMPMVDVLLPLTILIELGGGLQHSANGNSVAADSAALVGRILLALIFIISGYGKIGGYAGNFAVARDD